MHNSYTVQVIHRIQINMSLMGEDMVFCTYKKSIELFQRNKTLSTCFEYKPKYTYRLIACNV